MNKAIALSLLVALGLAASVVHAQSNTGKIQIFVSRDTSFITKPLALTAWWITRPRSTPSGATASSPTRMPLFR